MKKIANFGDKKLQKAQRKMLIEILAKINSEHEMKLFINSVVSESEVAYISQRLDIIRMFLANKKYEEIKDEIKAQANTLSNAKKCLTNGGKKLKEILLKYKLKRSKVYLEKENLKENGTKTTNNDSNRNFVKAHYPGAIRIE